MCSSRVQYCLHEDWWCLDTTERRRVSPKIQCRLRKSKEGGKAPPAREGVKKKYNATIRQPGLCEVRMKITRTVAAPVTVTIERLDSEVYHHDLERSREIAPSTLAVAGYGGSGKMICSYTGSECFERSWNPTGKRTSERCRWIGTVSTNYNNKAEKVKYLLIKFIDTMYRMLRAGFHERTNEYF